jgi:hypothetical protein
LCDVRLIRPPRPRWIVPSLCRRFRMFAVRPRRPTAWWGTFSPDQGSVVSIRRSGRTSHVSSGLAPVKVHGCRRGGITPGHPAPPQPIGMGKPERYVTFRPHRIPRAQDVSAVPGSRTGSTSGRNCPGCVGLLTGKRTDSISEPFPTRSRTISTSSGVTCGCQELRHSTGFEPEGYSEGRVSGIALAVEVGS